MPETADQTKEIQTALTSADSCAKRAAACARMGCLVLAREYDYIAQSLRRGAQWQRNALDADFMAQWKASNTDEGPGSSSSSSKSEPVKG